ncbi:MAG: Asp-tRNA(Asn)/Glu-tRNA(Gln) amidotransferase subunit GatA [Tissierellaceae bacterium]|nr:Asp-tRNA(Asn)/Glu-tRNA(Gln) amidotransferase subunit GatA [Tissierellaceae bacterium]
MDILDIKARDIREKIINKEMTAGQVVEAYIKNIEETEDEINAFISIDKEGARTQAAKIDEKLANGEELGILAGITIGIKDNIVTKDIKTTCGSKMLENYVSPYDATVIEIIKREDGIILGKMNMDEFAMGSSTETSYFGPTKNPINKELVPGGSSGGSAAAVKAKQVAIALGSDTGGSVRQPASFCGVVGIKPSYGRISRYGLVPLANTFDTIGILAKDTLDAAFLLSVLCGHDEKDPTSITEDIAAHFDYKIKDEGVFKNIKIGIPKELFDINVDDDVKESFLKTIELIKENGGIVEEVSLPHLKYAIETYLLISNAEASANLARFDGLRYGHRAEGYETLDELFIKSRTEGFGEEVKRRIMLGTYMLREDHVDDYYMQALKVRTLIRNDFEKAFESCDVLLSPTSPTLPFKLGSKSKHPVDMYKADMFTVPINLAGVCAMSLPTLNEEGLPIGIQLIGNKFKEEDILNLGLAIERMVK